MYLSDGMVLDNVLFNALVLDQQFAYQQALPLRFLDRVRQNNADDNEIIATFLGKTFAADVIADDQEAAVYELGQLQYVTNTIPNLKIGTKVTQSMMARLNRLRSGT